jgi:CHASE2 domain-containing sensor protein
MSKWVEQEAESVEFYHRLEQTAQLWKNKQAALWGTPDLKNAVAWKEREKPTPAWASRYGCHFKVAMEFLDTSIRKYQRKFRLLRVIRQIGVIVIPVMIIVIFLFGAFEVPELLTYDWRFNLRGERKPLQDILIITIDEESEQVLQQGSHWNRSLHAEMIRTLIKHKPRLIVYDVIFKDPTEEAEDKVLANALYDAYDEERDVGLVILAGYISYKIENPLDIFANNAGGVGIINLYQDKDKIVRRVPSMFLASWDEGTTLQYHLCLSLEAAALYHGGYNAMDRSQSDTIVLSRIQNDTTQEVLRIGGLEKQLYINYIGGQGSYPMIPFWKIIRGEYKPEDIEGKVIFIGDTRLTSYDYFWTPFQTPNSKYVEKLQLEPDDKEKFKLANKFSFGIEIHAQAFQTILENSYIRKVSPFWSVLIIFGVGTLSGIVFFKNRGFLINTAFLLLCAGFVWGVSQYLFSAFYLWVYLAPLEIVIAVNYGFGLALPIRENPLYSKNRGKGAS